MQPEIKLYKTLVVFSGDVETQGGIFTLDTVEYEGALWLVGGWRDHKLEGWSTPTRLILLASIPHGPDLQRVADFRLLHPLPRYVLDGEIPSEEAGRYVVLDRPRGMKVWDRRRKTH